MSSDDSLLSRWSRRKRAVAQEQAEAAPTESDEDLPEPELLEKLGLPDPDTLTKGGDFSAFMQTHVPDFLRRRALRKLWRSDPVLANLDGLIDHGEDYTDAATVPDTLKTAYQVGKGILRQIAEVKPEPEPENIDTPETPAPEASGAAALADTAPDRPAQSAPEPDDGEDRPSPRRMVFRTG